MRFNHFLRVCVKKWRLEVKNGGWKLMNTGKWVGTWANWDCSFRYIYDHDQLLIKVEHPGPVHKREVRGFLITAIWSVYRSTFTFMQFSHITMDKISIFIKEGWVISLQSEAISTSSFSRMNTEAKFINIICRWPGVMNSIFLLRSRCRKFCFSLSLTQWKYVV